jgi:hypothetical protein
MLARGGCGFRSTSVLQRSTHNVTPQLTSFSFAHRFSTNSRTVFQQAKPTITATTSTTTSTNAIVAQRRSGIQTKREKKTKKNAKIGELFPTTSTTLFINFQCRETSSKGFRDPCFNLSQHVQGNLLS